MAEKTISLPKDIQTNNYKYIENYNTNDIPPPYSTSFSKIIETDNTSPNLLRSSMYMIPANKLIFNTVRLPIGIIINPFHKDILPYLESSNSIPSSICNECSTYICNFTEINEYKREYKCHICLHINKLNNISLNNKQLNPTTIYNLKETLPLNKILDDCLILIIDIRTNKSIYESYIKEINNILPYKNTYIIILSTEISILTINKSKNISIKKILTDNIIIPSIYTINNNYKEIINYLNEKIIIQSINNKKFNDLKLFNLTLEMSKNFLGTKCIIFSNNQFHLESNEYNDLIEKYIENNMSLSLFSLKETSLSRFIIQTNGKMTNSSFNINVLEPTFFSIKMDIKTSNSLSKSRVYANTLSSGISTFISQMNSNDTITISLSLAEKMKNKQKSFIQIQIGFYYKGIRKILILNQQLLSTESIDEVYEYLMFDSLLNVFLRYITDDIKSVSIRMDNVNKMIIESIRGYKKKQTKSLLLPSSLKSFFVLINAFQKHNTFINKEFYGLRQLANLPCKQLIWSLYPKIISFTDYCLSNEIIFIEAKFTSIDSSEIYLMVLDNEILLYISEDVDNEIVNAILNKDNEENIILEELFNKLNDNIIIKPLKVIRPPNEMEFLSKLIEDKIYGIPSLNEYLKSIYLNIEKTSIN